MALSVIYAYDEQLAGAEVRGLLQEGHAGAGASLLVPTFAQALDAQRALCAVPELGLGVTATTLLGWVKERWGVWGDGRVLADDVVLSVLARQAIVSANERQLGPMRLSAGLVALLGRMANEALPWLPLDAHGRVDEAICDAAGLTHAEALLVGLVGSLGRLLAEHGYLTKAQVCSELPRALKAAGAHSGALVVAGYTQMRRCERDLLRAMGELCDVAVVLPAPGLPGSFAARIMARALGSEPTVPGTRDASGANKPVADARRNPDLEELRQAFCSGGAVTPRKEGPVELLVACGPVAEAELIAERVEELVHEGDRPHAPVIVAVPDALRAERELLPKLAARGLHARLSSSDVLSNAPSMQAFLGYARTVATLHDLAGHWPAPAQGLEGPVPCLGDMSWWPPRELVDFLLSSLAHMDSASAWALDASWRGNRLLTPAQVLDDLRSEKKVSAPVARATQELLRGRLGSAASKLLGPFVAESQETGQDLESSATIASLQAVLRIAGTLRELGVVADPAVPAAIPLTEAVRLMEWAVQGMSVKGRPAVGRTGERVEVLVASLDEAAASGPGDASALVVAGCTTAEQAIGSADDLMAAVLYKLGVDAPEDPMLSARSRFEALLSVPRNRLVLERSLEDADGHEAYPAVMLAELLAVYGIAAGAKPSEMPLPYRMRAETDLARNLAADGTPQDPTEYDSPSHAGQLTGLSRRLVFVPQEGRTQNDLAPQLSASQIETYLDCPYKWFSLRRLGLGTADAGHGGVEAGTFAHKVLERTYRTLLLRALAVDGEPSEEELRLLAEAHLCEPLAGSRVDNRTLEEARSILELEFDLQRERMLRAGKGRPQQQLYVAHDSFEQDQELRLRDDLLSCLDYQTGILAGFEPRFFEWRFGGRAQTVSYAGVRFGGTVDRIDVHPDGRAVIIDYKHKSPQGFAGEYDALQEGVLDGACLPRRVQSLIYAQVVQRAFAGRLRVVGTLYLATRAPHALAGAVDADSALAVFGKLGGRREEQVSVPRTPEGEPGMQALLERTEELVGEQVERMLAGDVTARPRDRHSCDFCPVMQCERRVMR